MQSAVLAKSRYLYVCLSVCLSVCHMMVLHQTQARITKYSLMDSPRTRAFARQDYSRKLKGSTRAKVFNERGSRKCAILGLEVTPETLQTLAATESWRTTYAKKTKEQSTLRPTIPLLVPGLPWPLPWTCRSPPPPRRTAGSVPWTWAPGQSHRPRRPTWGPWISVKTSWCLWLLWWTPE